MDKLKLVIAVIAHLIGPDVLTVIKEKALEAATHDEWDRGEKTKFVEDAARALVAATPNPVDDMLIEFAIKYYDRKYSK